jgi:lipoprotein-anchoring transpeptidase ErfK/SrfK
MRNALLGVVAVLLAAVLIAVVVSHDDSPTTKTKTSTVTVSSKPPPQAPTSDDQRLASATLPLLATKRAHGAHGSVTIELLRGSRFKLTVSLEVPQKTYGIVLWSNRNNFTPFYTGYRGKNTQTFTVNASRMLRYRWLAVGQTIVRSRIHHVRYQGQVVRVARSSVSHRHLLRISTGRLLDALLRPSH